MRRPRGFKATITPFGPRATIVALVALTLFAVLAMIRMPGRSHAGALPPLSAEGEALAARVGRDVDMLAGRIGERNARHPRALADAADYIERRFAGAGYHPRRMLVTTPGATAANIEAIHLRGARESGIVVVGAHYDTAPGTPGADDNASGVAALLEIARALASRRLERQVRFVAFANEEPPHFGTDSMGSRVYARSLATAGVKVDAMLSLESLGYYDETPGSQHYPAPLGWIYPDRGDFVAFVGNFSSAALVRRAIGAFRAAEPFPSEGAALPGWMTGVGWSDHSSFWRERWQALMVTDTAPFRSPWYHGPADTADKVDLERLARVTRGLIAVVAQLASGE